MIKRALAALSGFAGGFLTLAVINDGANGYLAIHLGAAMVAVTIAGFTAARD